MNCERCGHEMPVYFDSALCSHCGTVIKKRVQMPSLQQNTDEQIVLLPGTLSSSQTALRSSHEKADKEPWSYLRSGVRSAYTTADFTSACPEHKAFMIEFVFSLLGIFGIGWLLVGRRKVGIFLLVCSAFLYWPVMILGTLLTLGFGLMCLGPLAIICVICDALLLNSYLGRRSACRR